VLTELEFGIEEAGARIQVGPLPKVKADSTQMRQLFQNLIGNAIKFRNKDVPPVIDIRASVEEINRQQVTRLEVEDNGIGFDEKYRDRIFSPFQRLHGRSAYPGSGIGLALCRRIIERHGGTITVRSSPGVGSCFIMTIPAPPAEL
jgi:signal transduction histidine kinase